MVGQLSLFLVRFESYETFSLYTVSLASKLSLMLFFNSAIVAFLASTFYTRNIYGPGGLIYTQMYFFISNAIIPPLVNLINPDRIVKLAKVWFIKKFNKVVTQQELNELYEYPPHAIELRYADIMKTLFITFFYAPLIPAGYLTSFLGLGLYYFSEKVRQLTNLDYSVELRHSQNHSLSLAVDPDDRNDGVSPNYLRRRIDDIFVSNLWAIFLPADRGHARVPLVQHPSDVILR